MVLIDASGAEFDYLETALDKFDDGPFFVGQFSQVSDNISSTRFLCRFTPLKNVIVRKKNRKSKEDCNLLVFLEKLSFLVQFFFS